MVFVVRIPFWLYKAEVQDYLKQIEEFSKAIIARNKHQDYDEDLVEGFIDIYHNACPIMKRRVHKIFQTRNGITV